MSWQPFAGNLPSAGSIERRPPNPLRAVGFFMLAIALGGCASVHNPNRRVDVEYDPALLSGERIFSELVTLEEVPDVDIVAVSDEMQAYLDLHLGNRRLSAARFKRLLVALGRDGYFSSTYQAEKTNTAAETFATKSGNCLSYTNMFIAMSRKAGLDARFQVVHVPPSWDADSGYLIRYTHINVLMRGVRFDRATGSEFTVDFNSVHPEPEYARFIVADDYATSLFYANRSVGFVRGGDFRRAFAYLKKAIELVPSNTDLWINLGALYGKLGDFDSAQETYEIALGIDGYNKAAMAGLARTYRNKGDIEKSEYYDSQVRRYRDRNPFYHFAIAQAAFESAAYEQSLASINTAIKLKGGNGRFYFMRGLAQQKLGDLDAAGKSFRKAERLGRYQDLKQRYVNELADVSVSIDPG